MERSNFMANSYMGRYIKIKNLVGSVHLLAGYTRKYAKIHHFNEKKLKNEEKQFFFSGEWWQGHQTLFLNTIRIDVTWASIWPFGHHPWWRTRLQCPPPKLLPRILGKSFRVGHFGHGWGPKGHILAQVISICVVFKNKVWCPWRISSLKKNFFLQFSVFFSLKWWYFQV